MPTATRAKATPAPKPSAKKAATSKATPKAPRECKCGCGEMTKGGIFKPGHDARFHAAEKAALAAK